MYLSTAVGPSKRADESNTVLEDYLTCLYGFFLLTCKHAYTQYV
jgi:hypothetical protein